VEDLEACGYKVIVVSETATEIINNGVCPWNEYYNKLAFQELILKYQLQREGFYKSAAQKMKNENIIIVYDRGAMDNKAYLSESDFAKVLKRQHLTEMSLKYRYDAVFELKSAADGAEEFYTLSNNTARKESIEEARELDKKIINAWTGHPYLRIIDNSTNFKEKIDRLMVEIFRFIGNPVPLKIEKKFLIEMPNLITMLESIKYEKTQMLQTYLTSDDPNKEIRIRQSGFNNEYSYSCTTQSQLEISNAATTVLTGKRITQSEYLSLLTNSDTSLRQIKKDRYNFVYNNLYFELDVYPFWNDKAVLEIKLTEQNQQFEIPSSIKILKDVTGDLDFRNHSIARNIPSVA
jgi:CYTH domain-containing protein